MAQIKKDDPLIYSPKGRPIEFSAVNLFSSFLKRGLVHIFNLGSEKYRLHWSIARIVTINYGNVDSFARVNSFLVNSRGNKRQQFFLKNSRLSLPPQV